jgi:DNA-binding transcriptional regulator GbsR (MarR family)
VGAARSAEWEGLSELEQEIVAVFVGLVQTLGLPKSYGEIYGLLYASTEPLSFNDLQSRLQLSKGSVSQGLRALRGFGAIKLTPTADDRRDYFVPETELRKLVAAFLGQVVENQLVGGERRLAEVRSRLDAAAVSPPQRKLLQSRINKLQSWHRQGRAFLPWVAKFLG